MADYLLFQKAQRKSFTMNSANDRTLVLFVDALESIAETQPQLNLALLRLSAMISQYFIGDPLLRLTLRSPQFLVYSFLLFPHVFQVTAKNG